MEFKGAVEGDFLPKELCIQIIISTIQEVLHQMFIVKRINGWPDTTDEIAEHQKYITIEEKHSKDEPQNILLSTQERRLALFRRNWQFTESVIEHFLEELRENGTYEQIKKVVDIHRTENVDTEDFLTNTQDKERKVAELKKEILDERANYAKLIEKTTTQIRKLAE